jgi:hypothetical protein
MFENFPKKRPELPEEFKKIYSEHYKRNRSGGSPASSLAQKMESWLHKQVASDAILSSKSKATLEIGAGNLNQLPYESDIGSYDIVEPFQELYKDSELLPRVRNIYNTIQSLPVNMKYDRITSIAAFEHICELPDVVARCGTLLHPEGVVRVSIPSEGTLLWRLGWHCTTGIEFKLKYGLDYSILMGHEHVNTAKEIEEILKYFFKNISCRVLGMSKSFSLYQFYACKNPDLKKCKAFLQSNVQS